MKIGLDMLQGYGAAAAQFFFVPFRRPHPPQGKKLDLARFQLTFEDQFEGNVLDPAKWKSHGEDVRRGGYWDGSQAAVRDGKLIIRTEYHDGKYGPGWYHAGLDTKGLFEQKYGYFEARCKLPRGQGLWSAFWMMCEGVEQETGNGKSGAEIDIFESPYYARRQNGLVTCNLHYDGYGRAHRTKNAGIIRVDNPYETFHDYGVEWNEREYIFYIDGVESCRTSFGQPSQTPEFLILSTEVDGQNGRPFRGWSGDIRKNPEEIWPSDFVVEYVRAYQYR